MVQRFQSISLTSKMTRNGCIAGGTLALLLMNTPDHGVSLPSLLRFTFREARLYLFTITFSDSRHVPLLSSSSLISAVVRLLGSAVAEIGGDARF